MGEEFNDAQAPVDDVAELEEGKSEPVEPVAERPLTENLPAEGSQPPSTRSQPANEKPATEKPPTENLPAEGVEKDTERDEKPASEEPTTETPPTENLRAEGDEPDTQHDQKPASSDQADRKELMFLNHDSHVLKILPSCCQ